MTPLRTTIALCLAFVAIVVGMFVYSVVRTPVLSDEQLRERGVFILPTPREIAPFELTAHTGEPFTLGDVQSKWSFIFFGFTNCPDICPTAMSVLAQARRQLEERDPQAAGEFQGILVSVDPERDDQQTLARYVGAFSPTFIGVRGDRAATAELTTQLNVAFAKVPADDGTYQVDHTANIVIVNPRGHYHGFAKMPHQADTIVATFETLRARWR
ncbi:MAG: SCO family protein [Pseudomonadales bacterium]